MQTFFTNVVEQCTDGSFLENVMHKYHYDADERESLNKVAARLKKCMRVQAVWEHRVFLNEKKRPFAEVAMTLGESVDELQESYLSQGMLSEAYMIEVLASELLLSGYGAYNAWVAEHTGYRVARYVFPEAEPTPGACENDGACGTVGPDTSLAGLAGMLERLQLPIRCNDAYCMLPKKSVAFYAALTEEEGTQCQGICVGCGNTNCPNRIAKDERSVWNFADMTDRPLPYGYARIFGKK